MLECWKNSLAEVISILLPVHSFKIPHGKRHLVLLGNHRVIAENGFASNGFFFFFLITEEFKIHECNENHYWL